MKAHGIDFEEIFIEPKENRNITEQNKGIGLNNKKLSSQTIKKIKKEYTGELFKIVITK